ncbi:MAG: TIGR03619 family F420-dependent LLM class oxidoreductase [Ilumatobacteraceae bacterium]
MSELSIHLVSFSEHGGDWSSLLRTAEIADAAGVDRVVVSDHVAFGERLDAYSRPELGGTVGGQQPTGPDGHWLEPVVLLAHLAARTERVRLGTAILLAALRTPAVLAKELATLDVLSGGRLDVGVGVGWQAEEYEACGLDFAGRGALLDECLEICHALWTEPVARHDGPSASFERIHQMPKPLQASGLDLGGLPIWVGGRVTPRTTARLVRFGHGWIPWGEHIQDPAPGARMLRQAFEDAGRDPAVLRVQGRVALTTDDDGVVDVEASLDALERAADGGVDDIRLQHRWGRDADAELDLLGGLVEGFRRRRGTAG